MSRLRLLSFVALSLAALPQRAFAQDTGGVPLACIGSATFYPRGDHWAMFPSQSVVVSYQPDGPSAQNPNFSGTLANQAVQAAMNNWTMTQGAPQSCSSASGPNISTTVSSYPTRDKGINISTNTFNNVVYWVIDPNAWANVASTTVVALTTNLYTSDTGYVVASSMQLNGVDFTWRTTDSAGYAYGCVPGETGCYDIFSVALHETGHFFGFNHVACPSAVMYPVADGTNVLLGLSNDEVAGICALYPPRTSATALSVFGEACDTTHSCVAGLTCLFPANGGAQANDGWCSSSCTTDNDCGLGYICEAFTAGTFCAPGIHLPGVAANPNGNADLCASCSVNAQCISNLCLQDTSTGSICTQYCGTAAQTGCPDGWVCTPTTNSKPVCFPIDPTNCPTRGAGLNDQCFLDAQTGDPNADFMLNCADPLACFLFTGASPVSGSCVQPCDLAGDACASTQQCCFSQNADGTCAAYSSGTPDGGCFTIGAAGAACVSATNSICGSGLRCIYTTSPSLSKCYRDCTQVNCIAGEECITGVFQDANSNNVALCCDSNVYDPSNPIPTCRPVSGPCLLQVGVTCVNNTDCMSNLCLDNGGTYACSQACNTTADCPAATVDVNGDGVADGGSTCQTIGGAPQCWPAKGPAKAPACANANTPAPASGCSCRDGAAGEVAGFILLGWLLLRRVLRDPQVS